MLLDFHLLLTGRLLPPPFLSGIKKPGQVLLGVDKPLLGRKPQLVSRSKLDKIENIKSEVKLENLSMYSNKLELPRRGRSFDSMNIGIEEKLLNNEVRTVTIGATEVQTSFGFKKLLALKTVVVCVCEVKVSRAFSCNFLTSLIGAQVIFSFHFVVNADY